MKRLASIQARSSWFLIAVLLDWGLSISSTSWVVGRDQVDEILDGALLEAAEILYELLTFDVSTLPMQRAHAMPTPCVHDECLVW